MRKSFKPSVEVLEDRLVPAYFYFRPGANPADFNWNTQAHWRNADNSPATQLPGVNDTAVIEGAGCDVNANTTISVEGLVVGANLDIPATATVTVGNLQVHARIYAYGQLSVTGYCQLDQVTDLI